MKNKETIEEAADRAFPFAEKIGGEMYTAYRGFITGAKWQAERMYTKDDVLKAGEIGEINHHDYKHIVSLLDEAKKIPMENKETEHIPDGRKTMSSIEWLVEQFSKHYAIHQLENEIEQAKEMHKQEIKNAYWDGGQDVPLSEYRCEKYYNQKFNPQNNEKV
jgi:vacuolar-type H+-ATPase subunit H